MPSPDTVRMAHGGLAARPQEISGVNRKRRHQVLQPEADSRWQVPAPKTRNRLREGEERKRQRDQRRDRACVGLGRDCSFPRMSSKDMPKSSQKSANM
eukprot:71424-Amorphochlora_amoeboformis.AAC.2